MGNNFYFGIVNNILLFIPMLWGLLFLDARMTGWHRLAERFRAKIQTTEGLQRVRAGGIGKVGLVYMRNIQKWKAMPEGLYLQMPWIFRFQHPSLVIPWSEMQILKISDSVPVTPRVALSIGNPEVAKAYFYGEDLAEVLQERLVSGTR